MAVTWLPIATIPKMGMNVFYSAKDVAIWEEKLQETLLECSFIQPLEAEVTLQIENDGVLISGSFTAQIVVPCSFCLEPANLNVGHIFYDLIQTDEEYIIQEGKYLRESKKGLELDVAEIVFEEFLMDASISVRCRDNCLGLCALCGVNKNIESCSCDQNKKDPRFEKLHELVLEKKK